MTPSKLEHLCAERLAAAGIAFQRAPEGLRVPAACTEVGDLLVCFDNDEITVDIEKITHCHFTPYGASPPYAAHSIEDCIRDATDFVGAVLRDEWMLWRYPNGAGGCYQIGTEGEGWSDEPLAGEGIEKFVWSGRSARA